LRVREAHKSINPEGWWQRFRGDGGPLRVREAHKSINPEGWWQRFRGDGEPIPPENSSPQRLQGVGRPLLTEVAAPFIKKGLPFSFFILPPNPST